MPHRSIPTLLAALLLAAFFSPTASSRDTVLDTAAIRAMEFRGIGPYRGGRSAAVAGIPDQPMTYYFGATGGGVWRTDDGGQTWRNVSDGYFGGSIGAVAVSEWDPNVVYVGGGEKTVRGNVSHGYGMWKSLDAGKTWTAIGLADTRHIPRIRIHPRDPDLVYVAALGHLFGPSEERGIYRSRDGGATWERILFVNDNVGAVDLLMDPTNPRILYATMWNVRRTPYSLESGGPGSGIWKSTDGGDTWTDLSRNPGMPEGTLGIIGVTVSPVRPERVWAIVEADEGGVFRSENGGRTWRRVNDNRSLRQRAWYYTRIYADPVNADGVYVLNVRFWRSKDGGRSFESIRTPHGDHHDLWIDPDDPLRMIVGDDGGAQVSVNGGASWSTYHNQPTAQFYRVTTDNHFPYRIYGAQQDNSTVRILHRSSGRTIDERDWEPTAGGESGWLAPDPDDPEIVYGGSYGGYLTRVNHRTGEVRAVNVWPDNPMGYAAGDLKYRFQWNFPILFSPHDGNTLYAAGNVLFKSTDEGQSWTAISPDLTRADPTTLGSSGGPITQDNTSVEYYATIFAVVESPHEPGVIWAGSDDGLIHLTRDGGQTWTEVTPPDRIMPEWMQINSLEAHPTEPGGLYVAGTRYKSDDFAPYLYRTRDYGKTWTKITRGIDPLHFARVVRTDPGRSGLLYAGTESGLYISFDDGDSWMPFQRNLPIVPITDLAVHENDLIVATQGRSFWVMDDLTPLHQMTLANPPSFEFYTPRPTWRMRGGRRGPSLLEGQNPPNGVMLAYRFTAMPDSDAVALKILEADGDLIQRYTPTAKSRSERLPLRQGQNRFVWDMRYADADTVSGMILWAGMTRGPQAVPGAYRARLIVGADSVEVPFEIRTDPRSTSTVADMQAAFDFLIAVRDTLSVVHGAIKDIRSAREQIGDIRKRAAEVASAAALVDSAEALSRALTAVEEALYQTKNRSPQDPLNYPIRLNNRLAALAGLVAWGDFRPTDQAFELKALLEAEIAAELAAWRRLRDNRIPAFNAQVAAAAIPAVRL